MLKSVLKGEQCASCKICCSFVRNDVWEAPEFTKDRLNENAFKDEDEILFCPALDRSKGCTLGEDKPFDCKIWPLRPFMIDGKLKIGVANICPAFKPETDYRLKELLENGLYDTIVEMIGKDDTLVKGCTEGYRIIL